MPAPAPEGALRGEIAGVPVADLARDFGTPVYVYDAAVVGERIRELSSFDAVRYAAKANGNLAILDLVRRHGALIDAVSAGEVLRALAAGYSSQGDPPPIVYTADLFDRDALDVVARHGVHVTCGSADMIDQYAERTAGGGRRGIWLRVNPGFGHGHSRKTNTGGEHSKHGIWHEDVPGCVARAERHGLRVTGLHMHIGSGADLENLSRVCSAMEAVAGRLDAPIDTISAGGGLPVPHRRDEPRADVAAYFRLWDETRRRLERHFGRSLRLEIEPGRYVVAESGFLLAEIRAVKRSGRHTFYIADAGFNSLARPALYGAWHPMWIAPARSGTAADRPLVDAVVGGPLCESGDIFTQDAEGLVETRRLPAAEVGDLLVIGCAGAYGFTMSSSYNARPLAAEVLVRDGKARLVRARQSFDDLVRGEILPGE